MISIQNLLCEGCWLAPLLAVGMGSFLAYAETHYKFRFIPSRYKRRAPEIIADLPRRLSPQQPLPILIFIKDAHIYPIQIESVRVRIWTETSTLQDKIFALNEKVSQHWWHRVLHIAVPAKAVGWHRVSVDFTVMNAGVRQAFSADNYVLSGHEPFFCYFASEPLPLLDNYYTGDLHTHSWYTSDQVEFGAPPAAMTEMARAAGHQFLAITDHSYDLDDESDNYLKNDKTLQKWRSFLEETKQLNADTEDFVVIPGEEVSCGNSRGQNVHFLVLNNAQYLPGAGDSGERWFRTRPDLKIEQVMAQADSGAAFFAAHPEMPMPFLQRLLLGRNVWRWPDYQHDALHGLQLWNGHPDGISSARESWIRLLLAGKRRFIIAGSDAHGDFNRSRQIKIPHLLMEEHEEFHYFGQHRTIASIKGAFSLTNLVEALKTGACSITSGPFLALTGRTATGEAIEMGGTLCGAHTRLEIIAISNSEIGALKAVRIYRGCAGQIDETLFLSEALPAGTMNYRTSFAIEHGDTSDCYYRAEVDCEQKSPASAQAMSNPIWHVNKA